PLVSRAALSLPRGPTVPPAFPYPTLFRSELEHDEPSGARDAHGRETTHRRPRLASGGAKRREIVLAEPRDRGRGHRRDVERPAAAPHARAQQRGVDRGLEHEVTIRARERGTPRIEVVRHLGRPLHAD